MSRKLNSILIITSSVLIGGPPQNRATDSELITVNLRNSLTFELVDENNEYTVNVHQPLVSQLRTQLTHFRTASEYYFIMYPDGSIIPAITTAKELNCTDGLELLIMRTNITPLVRAFLNFSLVQGLIGTEDYTGESELWEELENRLPNSFFEGIGILDQEEIYFLRKLKESLRPGNVSVKDRLFVWLQELEESAPWLLRRFLTRLVECDRLYAEPNWSDLIIFLLLPTREECNEIPRLYITEVIT
jgi:hypothetical protein